MKKILLCALVVMSSSVAAHVIADQKIISQDAAIKEALNEIDVEVLGIRFDKPDVQWDVFVRSGKQAYEVEVDAVTGHIVATEKESLAEIQAELSGDLSHEGVKNDVDK